MAKKYKLVIGIIGALLLLMFFTSLNPMDIGYLSGTQGLEAQFHSVYWNGGWWSSSEKGPPPTDRASGDPLVGTSPYFSSGNPLILDPDYSGRGMPKLCSGTQVMTRDADAPIVYKWLYDNKDGTATQFEMYRYRMDWAINVWSTGTLWEADGKWEDYPDRFVTAEANYGSGQIWIKLKPQTFAYFNDNPDQVFFAPSYIVLKEPAVWIGTDKSGNKILNDNDISSRNDIYPRATGEPLFIYYRRGGGNTAPTSTDLASYKDSTLDTTIFRDEYWVKIDLLDFQPYVWHDWWETSYKYPTAWLHFQVDLFVVGTWTVYYETGQVPSLEPHEAPTEYSPLSLFFSGLADFFGGPLGQLWVLFILAVIVIIVVTWFNPNLWTTLASRRHSGGEHE